MARPVRIGLIGCGVVGQGIMRLLEENEPSIRGRLGSSVEVKRIAVRDVEKERGPQVPQALLTSDAQEVLGDPDIDVVVEVMGGLQPAGGYVRHAIESGKAVVTANKALLAAHGHELIGLAEERHVDLYFEAAVAGGIPILRVLREALASDRITSLSGIVNGTSNYILTRMKEERLEFGDALREAQEAGYAEADPALDINGGDAAHKLTILATLAFGAKVEPAAVFTEGIEHVAAVDIQYAERFGYVVKPLAIGRALEGGAIDLRVHPALVDERRVLASISGAINAVRIEGAAVGPCLLSGLGAGAMPTAVSVVSDVIDVGRNLLSEAYGRVPQRAFKGEHLESRTIQPIEEHICRYYLRFSVTDRSGVLGRLTSTLGEHEVSIEQMIQDGRSRTGNTPVNVVLLTHPAREGDVRVALEAIAEQGDVVEPTVAIRIEDEE